MDGKKVSEEIKNDIKAFVDKLVSNNKRPPHLAAILVGDDGASLTYISSKIKSCEQVGFKSSLFRFKTKNRKRKRTGSSRPSTLALAPSRASAHRTLL